jgi:hypothetical protein
MRFLISHFIDRYPNLVVPLHSTSSNSCEVFFLKLVGMNWHECVYDFHGLLNNTNISNHIYDVEYTKDGSTFQTQHNEMEDVWEALYKLQLGEEQCDMGVITLVSSSIEAIAAMHED